MELVFPFLAGIVYVAGALLLKRAADLGADVWRITRICNFTIAAFFMPTWFLGGSTSWNLLWQPAVAGLLFVVGQVFSLLALKIGDVSVAIAVSSPHRAQAYDASRYVIEEIKKRLPVWKHEHYTDGRSKWVEGVTPEPRAEGARAR